MCTSRKQGIFACTRAYFTLLHYKDLFLTVPTRLLRFPLEEFSSEELSSNSLFSIHCKASTLIKLTFSENPWLKFFIFFLNHEINWDICIKLHVNVWKLVLPQPSLKLVRILSSYFFQKNKICLYSSFGKHVCHFFAKKPLHREKKAICFCLLINIKIIYIHKLFNWISVLLFLIFFCFLFLLTPSVISFDSPKPKILNQRFKKSTILNSRPLRANNSQNTSPW